MSLFPRFGIIPNSIGLYYEEGYCRKESEGLCALVLGLSFLEILQNAGTPRKIIFGQKKEKQSLHF